MAELLEAINRIKQLAERKDWSIPAMWQGELTNEIEGTYQLALMELNKWLHNKVKSTVSAASGVPPGNWYMVTVTTPKDSSQEHCEQIHDQAMELFNYKKIEVFYASLEKSAIYHVHYIVNIPGTTKNLERDLRKACDGYIVQIEKKVNSLLKWNGLCKYVMKREYDEKADTVIKTLINRIQYQEGSGYTLSP